jgi:hypothetical protein
VVWVVWGEMKLRKTILLVLVILVVFVFLEFEGIAHFLRFYHSVFDEYDLSSEFKCLEDQTELWDRRVQVNNEFVDLYCPPTADLKSNLIRDIIPVIFVFWNTNDYQQNFDYVSTSVNTAAKFNQDVVLLWFAKPNQNIPFVSNVKVVFIEGELLKAFNFFNASLYVHKSPNSLAYELFCFQRWFVISRYLEMNQLKHVFVADSDV